MPDATATHNARAHIDTLIDAIEVMVQTLAEEHQALSNADAMALASIAEHKATAVEKISRLYDVFKESLGMTSTDEPADTFTATLDNIRATTPQLSERLDQLVTLTRACRQSNQDNGTLVNLGLHNCQANLNLLQRLNQPAQSGTYGPHAQPEDGIDSLHRLQLRA